MSNLKDKWNQDMCSENLIRHTINNLLFIYDKDYEDLVVDELSPVAMRYCRLIKTIRLHCQM